MSSSDEEFFDACYEIDSPKSPGSTSLVFVDFQEDKNDQDNVEHNRLVGTGKYLQAL